MINKAHFLFGLAMAIAIPCDQLSTAIARSSNRTGVLLVQGRNAISGTVFGESNRPVADIYVELLTDVNSTINRIKTDGLGRFNFNSLANGRYKVKVLPYGTNYLEQIQEVILANVSAIAGSGSDRQYVDIYLRVDERVYASPFSAGPAVIFAQEIPEAAKKLYEEGISYLRDKKEHEGLDSLKRAIEAFPNYYRALDRLGAEYAMRGASDPSYYEAALILLTKAVEVNASGFSSVFGLGWTQYQLGLNAKAIENLRRATALYSKSPNVFLWLGKALKRASILDQAEIAFKRAEKLSDGKFGEVHWQMAGLYNDQKRYKEAAEQLYLFLKAEPKAADAEKIRALIKQLREKPDGGI